MLIDQLIPQKKVQVKLADKAAENNGTKSQVEAPVAEKNDKKFLWFFKRRKFIRHDSSAKSVIKAFSWRMVGTFDTILISYLITRKLSFAFSIGGIEVFTKIFLYYLHERVWLKIRF
jgi:uncharacterized membrane protein